MTAFRRSLGAVLVAVFAAFPAAAAPLPPAESTKLFVEMCSGCHSIGGGDLSGPDLAGTSQQPPEQIRESVERMEDHVGDLTDVQIEGLVALLRDPAAKERVAEDAADAPPPVERGSAANGRRLFYGEQRFQNGGVGCFACHTADGRGGNLASDLTAVHTRIGNAGLLAASERPAFPVMKGAYAAHPLSHAEALDVVAFLEESARQHQQGVPPLPGNTRAVHGAATGLAAVVFAAVAVVFRPRRNGQRSRNSRR
jgi:mono/diheme cytochrome c family protein